MANISKNLLFLFTFIRGVNGSFLLVLSLHIIFWIAFLVWFFRKQYAKPFLRLIVWSGLLKAVATIAFIYLHRWFYAHYTPDYLLIFEDACKLSDLIHQNSLEYVKILFSAPQDIENWHLASQIRAFFAVKCYSVLVWFTGKNFWLSMFYASGAALVALWWLTQTLIRWFPAYRKEALVSFVFLPSLTFWASATSKESLLVIFLATLSVIFLQTIYHKWLWWRVPVFLIVAYWLLLLKYYYAFGFFLVVCLYVFLFFIQSFNLLQKIVCVCGAVVAMWGLTYLHPNLHLNSFVDALYNNYTLILRASPEGSALDLGLEPTWRSLFIHSPIGLWVGLFAPLPHQISKWQMLPIALENVSVLALMGFVLLKIIVGKVQILPVFNTKNKILWICLWVFVGIMATFLGLSSPNFGALSRYRVGFYPFLVFGLLVSVQALKHRRGS